MHVCLFVLVYRCVFSLCVCFRLNENMTDLRPVCGSGSAAPSDGTLSDAAVTSPLVVSDKEAAIYPVITGSKAAVFGHRHDAAGVSTVNEQLQSPIRSGAIRAERSR